MKTKYSISILKLLSILFLFASCEKDDLDTWVSIEADKTVVAVDETVTFKMSGNAETYVVYTGDASHDFTKSYLVITGGVGVGITGAIICSTTFTGVAFFLVVNL